MLWTLIGLTETNFVGIGMEHAMWAIPILLFLILQVWNVYSRLRHTQQIIDMKLDLIIHKMGIESELIYEISKETRRKIDMNNRIGAIRQISKDNDTDFKQSARILEMFTKEGRVIKTSLKS